MRDQLSKEVRHRLISLFKEKFPDDSIQRRGRIQLMIYAFSKVPLRVSAYLAFEEFRVSEQTRIREAYLSGKSYEPNELLLPILSSIDGVVESCVISFSQPFTQGYGCEGSNIDSADVLTDFLKAKFVPILMTRSGTPLQEIVDQATTQRHRLIAHADGSLFDYGERKDHSFLRVPISGIMKKSLETAAYFPQTMEDSDNIRKECMKELSEAAELLEEALRTVERA